MNMLQKLVPTMFMWLGVVVVLALAPNIETYNGYIASNITAASNAAYMIGMTAIDQFGGFIMIVSLLLYTGIFAIKKQSSGSTSSVQALLQPIGIVIIDILLLSIYSGSLVTYFNNLITAGTGFAKTAYGIFPVIVYVAVIGGGWTVEAYKKVKGAVSKKKGEKKTAQGYAPA